MKGNSVIHLVQAPALPQDIQMLKAFPGQSLPSPRSVLPTEGESTTSLGNWSCLGPKQLLKVDS